MIDEKQTINVNQLTLQDLKLSLLITSAFINAFFLVAWLVVEYGAGYRLVLVG